MVEAGAKAPAIALPDQNGKVHTLEDYKGKWVVLYFYPKDNTPGCTTESCGFRDAKPKYNAANAVIFGISCDNEASHTKFIAKYNLPFNLLADTNKKTVTDYGVYKEKSMYGKKCMGIERTTFLIDPQGNIAKIYHKVKPNGHEEEVLSDIIAKHK